MYTGGSNEERLCMVIDSEIGGALKHLGEIADFMDKWEGKIAEGLELSPADIADIKLKHPSDLRLQMYDI